MNHLLTRIPVARVLISIIIPLVGYFFFEWKLFDVAMLYLLESVAIFFVFNFHQYFVRKETRYPVPFALIQLAFAIFFFGGMIMVYAVIAYGLSGEATGKIFGSFAPRIEAYNVPLVLSTVTFIELISFYAKLNKNKSLEDSNFFRVMKRLLYLHLLIIVGMIPLMLLAFSQALVFIVFIGMKVAYDMLMDNLRMVIIIRKKLGIQRKRRNSNRYEMKYDYRHTKLRKK